MAYNIFPGVYTTIRDESFYVQPLPGAIGFICMFAEKGPDNMVRMTTGPQDLIATYGKGDPAKYGQGWYVAMQYLGILGNLYTMRVTPSDATYSVLCLKHDTADLDSDGTDEDVLTHVVPSSPSVAKSIIDTMLLNNDADVIFYPVGRGSWYNNISLKVTPALTYENAYIIDVYQAIDNVNVPALIESFTISFNREAKDVSGESMFVENVLERYSEYVRASVSDRVDPLAGDTWHFELPFSTWIPLAGGTDGSMYDAYGKLNWTVMQNDLENAYVGLTVNPMTSETNEEVVDPDCLMFSVVFDAGYPTPVKDRIVDLCESRTDCFAFLDNGDNSRPQTALTTRTNTHNYQTYQAALYEMYTKVYDTFTGQYIWMTPVYHVARAFAKTERDYDIWWPFAGLNRGTCNGIKDVRYKLVGGYKDQFKLSQLNPIMRWAQGGDTIWGNWTCQSKPSSLQNIHVVLCLLYIKRVLEWNLKYFIYEFNDEYSWSLIKENVNKFLGDMQSRRALEWYSVKVFANDYDKKINRCQVVIDLRVTGAIEVISITLVAH